MMINIDFNSSYNKSFNTVFCTQSAFQDQRVLSSFADDLLAYRPRGKENRAPKTTPKKSSPSWHNQLRRER